MNILVSACLLGANCRYDGSNCYLQKLEALRGRHSLIPVCPEIYGGLPTPRAPAEIIGGRVIAKEGRDVTAAYEKGAAEALALSRRLGCQFAILKEKSPSCGCHLIYDGSFSGKLVEGSGILARMLIDEGLTVLTEDEVDALF